MLSTKQGVHKFHFRDEKSDQDPLWAQGFKPDIPDTWTARPRPIQAKLQTFIHSKLFDQLLILTQNLLVSVVCLKYVKYLEVFSL